MVVIRTNRKRFFSRGILTRLAGRKGVRFRICKHRTAFDSFWFCSRIDVILKYLRQVFENSLNSPRSLQKIIELPPRWAITRFTLIVAPSLSRIFTFETFWTVYLEKDLTCAWNVHSEPSQLKKYTESIISEPFLSDFNVTFPN